MILSENGRTSSATCGLGFLAFDRKEGYLLDIAWPEKTYFIFIKGKKRALRINAISCKMASEAFVYLVYLCSQIFVKVFYKRE
jgi:hypothetical protein